MRKFKLIAIMSMAIMSLYSQTSFQGGIYSDTQWTKDNSPYIITGDVVVFPDKTLTIQPGVEVRFNGYYFLEIRGTLNSTGTATSRIVYTSNLENPDKTDWVGIRIKNNQGAKASFECCDFSHAEYANIVDCCWEGGPIYFKNCTFDNNYYAMVGYTGYYVQVDSCTFTNNIYCVTNAFKNITNSNFSNNDYGLFMTEDVAVSNSTFSQNKVALYGGRALIEHCNIVENGIAVQAFYEGFELRNNIIENNDTALILASFDGHYPPVIQNHICNNGLNVINADDINKDLTGNCWCISDSAAIEEKLIDGYDNIYLGLLNYDIYDENCETKLKSVKKVDLGTGLYLANTDNIVNIYPNPFLSQINIDIKSSEDVQISISVYNLYGQEIYHQIYSGDHFNIQLDNLNSGIYMCSIKTRAFIINKKIIKR